MVLLYLTAGLALMTLGAYFSYAKNLGQYLVITITLIGLLSNLLWALVVKNTGNNHSLMKYGLYWDIGITLVYTLVPILFFQVRPSPPVYIGGLLAVIGIILVKVG
jgi:Co/Zn/Cd efflux system component